MIANRSFKLCYRFYAASTTPSTRNYCLKIAKLPSRNYMATPKEGIGAESNASLARNDVLTNSKWREVYFENNNPIIRRSSTLGKPLIPIQT